MVPNQVSHYRIVARLGQGGMGEVYLAEDLSLDRKVALKFLLAGLFDDGAERRLLHEAKAAAHLDHPFICKVYEVGEHEGRPFLATEYVDGMTLKERLATGQLPRDEALRIAAEVAEALHFAHTRGIVHRDVKPANVMIGADGHVKVMDFGIAKRLAAPISADAKTVAVPTASVPGELTGTLAYMSPEQLRGGAVDQRSDTFAFGVLLHELLTGRHPFLRASIFETANAILNEPAPQLDRTAQGTSPLLAHVVARCLEKDRDRRYQSLSDVRIELENRDASGPAPPPANARRRARWIVASTLAGLIALAGLVNWVRPLPFFASEPALAFKERDWILVADFNNMTGDAVFDRSLRVALEVAIAQAQYVIVYPPHRVAATLQRMRRAPLTRLDETLAAEVAERENVRGLLACDIAQLGNTYSLTARFILPQTRVAVLTESVTATNKDNILGALDELAKRVRRKLGESVTALSAQSKPLPKVTTSSLDALKLYSDALIGQKQSGAADPTDQLLREALERDPHFALAHAELGRRYYLEASRQAREEGEKHFQQALAATDRLTLRERLWIQAVAEDSRGNRQRAVQAFETYLGQYPDDVRALFRLSWTRMATLGEWDKAIEGFKRVVTLEPNGSSGWVNLASAYAGKRDFEHAVPSYQKAFALNPSLILGVFINHEYGFTLVETGKTAEAEVVFDRMTKEADPPSLRARGFRSLALLEMYRGRYTAAVERLRHAIAINQTYNQGVSEFRDRVHLVTALDALGRFREMGAEWAHLDRRIATLSLSPDWLARPIKMKARRGDIAGAKRLMQSLLKTTGRATADASVARNTDLDLAWASLAQAELDLAEGRAQRAIELLERGHIILKSPHSMESLANAYAAGGRLAEAVARYEEIVWTPRLGDETQEIWQRSHVALARLYERLRRPDAAKGLYSTLAERWKQGDSELVLLKTSRDQLARLTPGN